MNETYYPDSGSKSPWSTPVPGVMAPGSSTWPDSDKIAPAAENLLDGAVQGAHDTIDRFADSAAPAIRQLGDNVAAAEEVLHEKADHLRHARDEWVAGVRSTVRSKPLACMAGAFALGAVIARITR